MNIILAQIAVVDCLKAQIAGMKRNGVMPVFVFGRRRDIEIENNFVLAGQLIVDVPKGQAERTENSQMILSIVEGLTAQARSGQMPDAAVVIAWPDGERPADADATLEDDALMATWALIALRVDADADRDVVIDRDIRRQLGLLDS